MPDNRTQVERRDGLWCVRYNGRITSPRFNSPGAAAAYIATLRNGTREPEYEGRPTGKGEQ